MNNTGNFNNGPPTALMSYPFPMHNPPQRPSLMEQPYMNQMPQQFQPYPTQAYNPRPIIQTPKSEKRKQEILTCDVCGIEVNSQQMMDAHLQGQKHIKKMKLKAGSTAIPPANPIPEGMNVHPNPPLSAVAPIHVPIESTVPTTEPNPVPPVVAKSTSSNEKSVLQLINEMAKFNRVNAKYDLIKETGPAHSKQFEVRLTLAEESYIGNGTSIKRAQQDAAEQALAATALKKPESTPRGSHSTRAVRGGGGGGVASRGSKFLFCFTSLKKKDNYVLRMKLRLI
jgi:hypothetical protein